MFIHYVEISVKYADILFTQINVLQQNHIFQLQQYERFTKKTK